VYVMGTSVNVGKSVCSLGIVSGMMKRFDKVGYMKPVGGYAAGTRYRRCFNVY
jgi:BioD-like phosphotransacetylase family protein